MRWIKRLAIFALILGLIYSLGPSPKKPEFSVQLPTVPALQQLSGYIQAKESKHQLRPNNEARIVWADDSLQQLTEFAIVYIHGFSASQEEGNPVHRNIAKTYGCNLYLARLAEHGIDTTEQLLNLTADNYWESAKEALAIGEKLGKKVILMATSTGGSQALQLAAAFPDKIAGLILYSPNIAINDSKAWLLNNPWGLQIARLVKKSDYIIPADTRPIYKQYWNTPYRLEAAVALQEMLENSMTAATFQKVKQPVLLLYYYKDATHQDEVVKVSAMLQMFDQLATPANQKKKVAMPNTGNHVIGSPIKSNDAAGVERETNIFLQEIMHFKAKQ
ncbi:MAG: hypothetical protein RLY16_1337 [Bacteroidota bacterium]